MDLWITFWLIAGVDVLGIVFTVVALRRIMRNNNREILNITQQQLAEMKGFNTRIDSLIGLQEIATRRLVKIEQRTAVARFLMELPPAFLGTRERRDRLLLDLPRALQKAITRSDTPIDDIQNITYTIADWSADCFKTFLDAVEIALDSSNDGMNFKELRRKYRLD